ncbi:glycosyltransferase family 2 protein [Bifidobacterium oedipodis]|uniref:Glycosyl transferase n=1 Tax=Bifidobacterium oedipodis TaxID=2675322 RepID=A0A7Y0HTF3_9BIFI|nr:glycosyltransferase [Bifidobacterium sp. DSM 109957]NMM94052.1 glycosyl transferase [Bifidobacterium sp. DSM 109957]
MESKQQDGRDLERDYGDGFAGWGEGVDDVANDDLSHDDMAYEARRDHPLIGCVIPAYNEEDSIASVLEALLAQTVIPDEIHVVVNNSTDRTVQEAKPFAGLHRKECRGMPITCAVYVHDIGENPDKKVGALNYGFAMVEAFDYFLGVDGDTVAHEDCVELLLDEIRSNQHIGGVSAIYTVDDRGVRGPIRRWLVAGQRQQFAAFNIKAMQQSREVPVLGGQFSIFSIDALKAVMEANKQMTPWITQSEVEDSLLSLQLKSAGYNLKISASARADVGGMLTMRALDGQQVKWNAGAVELMRSYKFHPCLRQRWLEHISMFFNAYNRFAFVFLLAASLRIGAFVFFPIWLVPVAASILLNTKIALKMRARDHRDVLFALLFLPAEMYLWIRIAHFLRGWWKSLVGRRGDNWAAQARAEKGKGRAYVIPWIVWWLIIVLLVVGMAYLPLIIQTRILFWGWLVLAVITAAQTLAMAFQFLRPTRGYLV